MLNTLPKRELGKTGLLVTPLCIGTGPLGSMEKSFGFSVPQEEAEETINEVINSPINFMDTSSNYGESEKRIGHVIKKIDGLPEGFVLATKADRDMETGDFSGDQMKKSVEKSLKLLHLENLQLVYLHDPEHTTFEEVMKKGGALEALQKMKDEGVIKHIGIGGGPIDMLIKYIETDSFETVITHNRYNLIYRTADPLLNLAAEKNMGVLSAAPFASGILAKGSAAYPRFAYRPATEDIMRRVKELEKICEEYNVPLKTVALHFSLRDPRITSTIIGVSKPSRIADTIQIYETVVPDEIWKEIDAYALYEGDPEKI